MKKFICLLLIFTMMLTACSKWKVEIVDPTKPIENDSELVVPEEKKEEYYLSAGAYLDYGMEFIKGKAEWNSDNTFTFQHENTIKTISAENELLETVTLPKENLPKDGGYDLSWNEKYILAIDKQIESSQDQFGLVCFDEEGKVYLANVALLDWEGNLVKEYNKGAVGGYNEHNNYQVCFPDGKVFEYDRYYYLADGNHTYWIDEDKVIFECHLFVVYYDFSKDEGKILDDMRKYGEIYGKFDVYYGVQSPQCGVLNGDFYYLSTNVEQNGKVKITIWRANENGAEELFEGKEFWHFFVGNEILIAVEGIDGSYVENGSIVYAIEPENLELKEIYRGDPSLPFGDDGKIRFNNSYNQEPQILYSYDYKTGELFEDVGNTEFEVESIVPGYTAYVMKSQDGKYFAEYDPDSVEPRLRILPCD
ncbi:MAG: hypothetical protein IJ406_03280 [Oscillospiraceae bacterium]|nr:hypothetical protein [Oscillospiraceae bacterium]